ncbi:NlpC/P60 family protein [Streptomyces ficellus]|uniref:NlpC/P60 family protein n=1 Tax=Streptomyces ficellus TaxID=1977088 RepID=A0ABT7Z5J4_9ACTN|nr:NlpC/P60 family protein [Streptomyces ficellus]MDN3294537.1 NlpC/P60 family protein [Streptomyces ficellus]
MSGKLLRAVCAVALAAALPVAPAAAAPTPEPEPRPEAGPASGPEAGSEAGSESSSRSGPESSPASVSQMLGRLRTLYQQAEEATETYNATEEELKALTAETRKLTGDLVKTRDALARGRADAGRLARAQYQGRTEFSAALQLLLARDPDHALAQNHVMRRAAREQAATVARLEKGEKRADQLATASRKALDREQTLAERQKEARDAVTAKLREVEETLASLSTEEVEELADLEETQTADAQRELLATGELAGARTPSEPGGQALQYAAEQIGKPYVWGAEGPESFDCSGLTSRAWEKAGRSIPRTSQEQWRTLPKVPLRALRPGDLVVYFPKATHVAIYLGNGLVIQAPRPGARVKVSPIAANPLLGAVRPDPAARPLRSYTPPELPTGAAAGSDEGYDEG